MFFQLEKLFMIFSSNLVQLDPVPHSEKELDLDPHKMDADQQPCKFQCDWNKNLCTPGWNSSWALAVGSYVNLWSVLKEFGNRYVNFTVLCGIGIKLFSQGGKGGPGHQGRRATDPRRQGAKEKLGRTGEEDQKWNKELKALCENFPNLSLKYYMAAVVSVTSDKSWGLGSDVQQCKSKLSIHEDEEQLKDIWAKQFHLTM